jgi:hypothetical protein
MGIEALKPWHWLVIGLILGAVTGFARWQLNDAMVESELSGKSQQAFDRQTLEQLLRYQFNDTNRTRYVQNLTLHPWKNGYAVSFVLPQQWRDYSRRRAAEPKPGETFAVVPGHYAPRDPKEQKDLKEWLDKIVEDERKKDTTRSENREKLAAQVGTSTAKQPIFGYRFAWWQTPAGNFAIWGGSVAIVVGLIWPQVLKFLVGAGFGRPPREEVPDLDLSRYSGKRKAARDEGPKALISDEDLQKLLEIEADLEKRLAADAKPRVAAPVVEEVAAPVRDLDARPTESHVQEKPKDNKAFGTGREDFYPTEVHVTKKPGG